MISLEIQGWDKMQKRFKKAPKVLQSGMKKAMGRSIAMVETESKRRTPVLTGLLKSSIGGPQGFKSIGAFKGTLGTNVKYACVFGASTMIRTKKGLVRIADVKKNDYVLTQDGNYYKVIDTPRFKAIDKPNLVSLEIEWRKGNNHSIILTNDHKVLSKINGCVHWIEAGKLKVGDIVFQPIKKDYKRGSGAKNKEKICKYCGNKYTGLAKFYCSPDCRDKQWCIKNPNTGKKRKGQALENIITGVAKNRKKITRRSKPQLAVGEWLSMLGIKYCEEYRIGNKFADFYIPKINTVIEVDGAYWHKDQKKDIDRDKYLIKYNHSLNIIHIHLTSCKYSKNIKEKPLKNVVYIQVNPNMNSYIDLNVFTETKIVKTRHFKYTRTKQHKSATLYDLTVDKIHSFVAAGIIISNSHVNYGRGSHKVGERMFMEKGLTAATPFIKKTFQEIFKKI